jgi:hypothetical protein
MDAMVAVGPVREHVNVYPKCLGHLALCPIEFFTSGTQLSCSHFELASLLEGWAWREGEQLPTV